MDTKTLETLDYKPTSAPQEGKGDLIPIIELETASKFQEVAGQHLNKLCTCPICQSRYKNWGQPIKTGCAIKSTNQLIFKQVEGAIKVILSLLSKIEVDNTDQQGDKQGCIWTLEGWYKNNLKWLKKANES